MYFSLTFVRLFYFYAVLLLFRRRYGKILLHVEEVHMEKLVLIDGNSLINRAFYATKLLTTRDGLPTNGVFGFTKLLIKIIADIKPEYMVVAFDLKAPTFRHKIFDAYKGTRKQMPEELAAQMPVMKSLLSAMQICICEKEGYEADDLIGTLSRKFDKKIRNIIITGDRDSYQLVNENTDVFLTKTGVSDLLKLTVKNFKETVGYEPGQVIDIKSLMGDSSDNIPGVAGIGEKTAMELIHRYDNLDNIYRHTQELKPALQTRLLDGKDMAYLSRKLATIDTEADIALSLEDCALRLPFPAEAKKICFRLEFSSIMRMDIFADTEVTTGACDIERAEVLSFSDVNKFMPTIKSQHDWAVYSNGRDYSFYSQGKEYITKIKENLLDNGLEEAELVSLLEAIFGDENKKVYVYGKKNWQHKLHAYGLKMRCLSEDVSILKYLTDFTGKDDDFFQAEQSYGLPIETHAQNIFTLFGIFYANLEKDHLITLYRDVELPLCDVLFDMEIAGVRVDVGTSAVFEKKYREEAERVSEEIYTRAGKKFNLNSPTQLGKILFDDLQIPPPKKNKTGKYSTNADVLEKLADEHEIVRDILRYRRIQKLLSTYIDGFRPLIDPKTQRVHTNYNQILTSTGRLSSTNPNLQNIPVRDEEGRELRKLFLASDDGHILLDADYSQIELRLLAHFSGCKELIEAYRRGEDIHALTASQVFEVPLSAVDAQMRRSAKAVNFGIIYGISDFGLAKNLDISPKKAGEYIKKYFETYSDVKRYMDTNVAFAKEHGYVTTILGRKRVINEIKSSNYNIRSFGERAAMNMPLQGSSADIIKIAMLRIYKRLREEKLSSRLILQVHDELVIDTLLEEKEQVAEILKSEMEQAVELCVPLVAEVHEGKNWYEAK